MEDELLNQLAVQIAQLRGKVEELESRLAESGGDSMDDLFLRIGGSSPAAGGTHMGNTEDSEEIEGDVIFESADDSNVEIATEVRTNESEEEENVVRIGVYWK